MRTEIVAVLISEGTKMLGQWFRNRPIRIETVQRTPLTEQISTITLEKPSVNTDEATEVATGCIPCAIGHIGTCSGLLNEALRFAREDGVQADQVVDRVGMCLDELNAMERVDLRPEMVINLPEWERDLADNALVTSRDTRHMLESIQTVRDLEKAAADTQGTRTRIWRNWIKAKMQNLTPEEREKVQQRVIEKLDEEEEE